MLLLPTDSIVACLGPIDVMMPSGSWSANWAAALKQAANIQEVCSILGATVGLTPKQIREKFTFVEAADCEDVMPGGLEGGDTGELVDGSDKGEEESQHDGAEDPTEGADLTVTLNRVLEFCEPGSNIMDESLEAKVLGFKPTAIDLKVLEAQLEAVLWNTFAHVMQTSGANDAVSVALGVPVLRSSLHVVISVQSQHQLRTVVDIIFFW